MRNKKSQKYLSPDQILAELKKGELRPIYYLSGEDPYSIRSIVREIKKNSIQQC